MMEFERNVKEKKEKKKGASDLTCNYGVRHPRGNKSRYDRFLMKVFEDVRPKSNSEVCQPVRHLLPFLFVVEVFSKTLI